MAAGEESIVTGRIAVGVIGCGFFAQNHLHAWRDLAAEGADLVAVCDISAGKAQAAGEKFGARWYTDPARMLDTEKPGLVDIVTGQTTHLPMVELALARRLPTVVQKPFGQDMAEVRRRRNCSCDSGTFLAVHDNFRFQPSPRLPRSSPLAPSGRRSCPCQSPHRL